MVRVRRIQPQKDECGRDYRWSSTMLKGATRAFSLLSMGWTCLALHIRAYSARVLASNRTPDDPKSEHCEQCVCVCV